MEMPVTVITAEELKMRARDAGLTTKELCRRAGVHPETIRRWSLGAMPSMRAYTLVVQVIEAAEAGSGAET